MQLLGVATSKLASLGDHCHLTIEAYSSFVCCDRSRDGICDSLCDSSCDSIIGTVPLTIVATTPPPRFFFVRECAQANSSIHVHI